MGLPDVLSRGPLLVRYMGSVLTDIERRAMPKTNSEYGTR